MPCTFPEGWKTQEIGDPEGGGQDDRRFSTGHGCPVEKLHRR